MKMMKLPKGLNYFGAETQSSVKQNKNTKKKNERKKNQHPSCARILGKYNNDNNVYFCTYISKNLIKSYTTRMVVACFGI